MDGHPSERREKSILRRLKISELNANFFNAHFETIIPLKL